MIKPRFKIFLEDKTSNFEKIGDNIYLKVPYNQNLVLLYYVSDFSLKANTMEYIGTYSLDLGEFLSTTSAYTGIEFCDKNDFKQVSDLEADLDERVQNELLAILESLITPNNIISEQAMESAKDFKMKGEEPIFSFHEYEGSKLHLENLEEFFADKDEYAYKIAEEVINGNPKCIEEYQLFVDTMKALTEISQDIPVDLELEMAISNIKQESSYKNLKIQVIKNGCIEEEAIQTSELVNYPLYAFNKIYWGRKLLFDINDYDAMKIDSLRTNREFNLKAVNGVNSFRNEGKVWDYVDERMFSDYEFCKEICKKYPNQYKRIDEAFRISIKFIKDSNVSVSQLFAHTPENIILGNKRYFLDLLIQHPDYFSYFPQNIREDIDFICTYVRGNGKDALHELSEDMFQYDKIQKSFDEWFLDNPTNIMRSWYNPSELKISLLKNFNTKVFALSIGYLTALSDADLNDEALIKGFLKRIKFANKTSLSADNFCSFYSALKNLKTNEDIVEQLFELCNIDDACWRVLDDSMKTKERQRKFVGANEKLLCLMDDDIKLEYVYSNPKKYLPLMNAEKKVSYHSGRRHPVYYNKPQKVDENLLFDLMKAKGNDLDFLEVLHYEQKSDEILAKKMMKINRQAYKYLDDTLRGKREFAEEAVKEFSVIQYLPTKSVYSKSLFDDRAIMEASLKLEPEDFYFIPQASRKSGPAPLLADKDFVLYAVKLDANNANYIDPKTGLLEDEDICFEAVTNDIDTVGAFAGKLFRNEAFVYQVCEGLEKTINDIQSIDIQNIWYVEAKDKLMAIVPKKIKDTNAFKARFPKFVD